ncbi:PAS domain S-box protein [Coleofasciculus sp. FACHB-1120]|uniref:PAS domain S-box protein n=1 Tax=Coleofasciculus sp. FACHB-1120 TaxID=2692783 RepID=UPI001685B1A4|nr:PAS domain S-box protein [Coleofasciculus sp. FACHB-1120]MBD2740084.1 PAS domain S-box protein [Coleofasciculus sp. FACHB-1120]
MNQNKLLQQISTLQQHFSTLHKYLLAIDSSPIQVLLLQQIVLGTAAFEEFCFILEDLLVEHEEVSQYNDYLTIPSNRDRQRDRPDTNQSQQLKQLQSSKQRLQLLDEQLQATVEALAKSDRALEDKNHDWLVVNEQLQAAIAQAKSTVDSLEARDGDLQVKSEQLDTRNEELRLTTEELRLSSQDLNEANAFLKSIFTSLPGGIAVLNQELNIQVWNLQAEDLWGLRSHEIQGQHFLNLELGLPIEQLRQPIQSCLAGESEHHEQTLDALNRRGRTIQCKVTCMPLFTLKKEIHGVIVLMQELPSAMPTL